MMPTAPFAESPRCSVHLPPESARLCVGTLLHVIPPAVDMLSQRSIDPLALARLRIGAVVALSLFCSGALGQANRNPHARPPGGQVGRPVVRRPVVRRPVAPRPRAGRLPPGTRNDDPRSRALEREEQMHQERAERYLAEGKMSLALSHAQRFLKLKQRRNNGQLFVEDHEWFRTIEDAAVGEEAQRKRLRQQDESREQVAKAKLLRLEGKIEQAIELAQHVHRSHKKFLGADHPSVTRARLWIEELEEVRDDPKREFQAEIIRANGLRHLGFNDGAVLAARGVLEAQRRKFGGQNLQIAQTVEWVAMMEERRLDFDAAQALWRESARIKAR
jgi:tetratricopeptide (TPR) repeat protein